MKIGIIGGGIMGEVIMSTLIAKNICDAHNIVISDLSEDRLSELRKQYAVATTVNNNDLVTLADIIIIAINFLINDCFILIIFIFLIFPKLQLHIIKSTKPYPRPGLIT